MLEFQPTTQFKKDYKRVRRRGLDIKELKTVLKVLQSQEALDEKYRDHGLGGRYSGFRECHIRPDWLLIYKVNEHELVLIASRTGTHSDLFDE